MDEDDKPNTGDDLTPEEQAIEDKTGASGEQAHRIGEFDELRECLERIENMLGAITSTLEAMRATAAAIDIDNGADVIDSDGDADVIDGDADADDEIEIPDYEDMDLDL